MKRILLFLLAPLLFMGCSNVFFNNTLKKSNDQADEARQYTVLVDSPRHGAIVAKPPSGPAGTEIILVVNPNSGYKLQRSSLTYRETRGEFSINDVTRSFVLPAEDITVSAIFEPIPKNHYSVSVVADTLEHGAIIAQPALGAKDTLIYLTVIPDAGYQYVSDSLSYNGMPISDLTRAFKLPAENVLLSAKFVPVPSSSFYTIRSNVPQNGQIFAKPEFSPAGEEVYLHVKPKPGHTLKKNSLRYKTASSEILIDEQRRVFTMPAEHIMVYAEFIPVPGQNHFSIIAENTPGGRIIPATGHSNQGQKISLHVIPDPNYALVANSLSVKPAAQVQKVDETTWTFKMPSGHTTITARFEKLAANKDTRKEDTSRTDQVTSRGEFEEIPKEANIRPLVSMGAAPPESSGGPLDPHAGSHRNRRIDHIMIRGDRFYLSRGDAEVH
jgi:hypothetical protein